MPRLPLLQAAPAFLSLIYLSSLASTAKAGWLASGSVGWGVFSLRPLAVESTPNYYAYAGNAMFGFSYQQRVDTGLYMAYLPGHIGAAQLANAQATLINYGLQTALRIREQVYLALRAGLGQYHLVKASGHPHELSGRWSGPGGGVSIGSLFRIDKRNYWQISLNLNHYELSSNASAKSGQKPPSKRQLDAFVLAVTYTFNGFVNHRAEGSLFKNVF